MLRYLYEDDVIDISKVKYKAYELSTGIKNQIDIAKTLYHFVRDEIKHSFDINATEVTITASDVLKAGHGICYAKSHLLAALLRSINIPCGFGYQKLILDDKEKPWYVLHAYNFIYLKELNKWIKVDARGNKPGVKAEFSVDKPKMAFQERVELGESDENVNHSSPKQKIIDCLRMSKNTIELANNLPKDF